MNGNENIIYQTRSTKSMKGKFTALHAYILGRRMKINKLHF